MDTRSRPRIGRSNLTVIARSIDMREDQSSYRHIKVNIADSEIKKANVGKVEEHNSTIYLSEYNPEWPLKYQKIENTIRQCLKSLNISIYHVGSTSVPGLSAKPIIDIVLEVPNSSDEKSYAPFLENEGFWLKIREQDWYEHRMFKAHFDEVNLHLGAKTLGVWAAEDRSDKRFIGWFMLKETIGTNPELGFMITKDSWNNGYVTETSKAFLQYARDTVNCKKVIASTVPENLASIRVLEKNGMKKSNSLSRSDLLYYEIANEKNNET